MYSNFYRVAPRKAVQLLDHLEYFDIVRAGGVYKLLVYDVSSIQPNEDNAEEVAAERAFLGRLKIVGKYSYTKLEYLLVEIATAAVLTTGHLSVRFRSKPLAALSKVQKKEILETQGITVNRYSDLVELFKINVFVHHFVGHSLLELNCAGAVLKSYNFNPYEQDASQILTKFFKNDWNMLFESRM